MNLGASKTHSAGEMPPTPNADPGTQGTEWSRSSAFYGRLTVTPNPELSRPSADFGRSSITTSLESWGVPGHPESQYIRRDLMDLGNVQDRFEFGKTLKIFQFLI